MIKCEDLYKIFKKNGFEYFTGVPDSVFGDWMAFLSDVDGKGLTNRIAAIERDAVGWASGYFAATGKIGVVYAQNSGLGNIVNPLTSLADKEVYGIPILLMVGWRGEPGVKDEPQHIKMGKITLPLLDILGVKYDFLPKDIEKAEKIINRIKKQIELTGRPHALIVRKGIFEKYTGKRKDTVDYELTREEAIKIIVEALSSGAAVIATTGKSSRELFEYRETKKQGHKNDFLMVGSMGLASSFGAEIALQKPNKKIFVFDGDGALLMSAGALSTIGYYQPKNFVHIVFDNESYDSTGGQPTTSVSSDLVKMALANGYKAAKKIQSKKELEAAVKEFKKIKGPEMIIVKIRKGSRNDLGRPTISPQENLKNFMAFLKEK
jgi:phosphonopyruvate decarboxylase